MINKTRSLEITIDVLAIRHVVIFQANFGYAYLQCIKYFPLANNKFISVFSLQKSSFERAQRLSLWKDYEKMNKLSYKQVHRKLEHVWYRFE